MKIETGINVRFVEIQWEIAMVENTVERWSNVRVAMFGAALAVLKHDSGEYMDYSTLGDVAHQHTLDCAYQSRLMEAA